MKKHGLILLLLSCSLMASNHCPEYSSKIKGLVYSKLETDEGCHIIVHPISEFTPNPYCPLPLKFIQKNGVVTPYLRCDEIGLELQGEVISENGQLNYMI